MLTYDWTKNGGQVTPVTEALMTISGNVLNTATVLAVVAAIKSPKPN